MKPPILLLSALLVFQVTHAQTTIIPYGSSWKFKDNGSNQGTTWRSLTFNDATWVSGNAQLGYGDGDEATIVSYGSSSSNKYVTTYFRKAVTLGSLFSSFTLNIKRDDGAVVYVNGVQVLRSNMPSGTISYTTLASSAASDDGNTPQTFTLPGTAFVAGNNVIAVEIHQNARNSTDLSFDLELTGTPLLDITAPVVNSYQPADNATGISNNANLVLSFNETIQKGTGNIIVKEGGVITQVIDVASSAVTVSGNTATIDPANFSNGAAVNIEISAGAFRDMANNNYAGITNTTTWNFNIIVPDITPPAVTSYSPADNASNVAVNANLVLNFSESI